MILRCLPIGLLSALAACSSSSSDPLQVSLCGSAVHFAIAVNVRDAESGVPAGKGATLYGTYYSPVLGVVVDTETVVTPDGLTMFTGAQPGTYDLRLRVAGYAEWSKTNVAVPLDEKGCMPKLTTVEALIQRVR